MSRDLRSLVTITLLTPWTLFVACGDDPSEPTSAETAVESLQVTSTAYVTTPSKPALGAWGDELRPGMRAIAVSRDLIALGLTHGTRVTISGLDGEYVVRDKMAKRWRRKIDVYMGHDRDAALEYGNRDVTISWVPGEP